MATRRLSIPTIGTVLHVARPWTFTAVAEHRNKGLMDYLTSTGIIPGDLHGQDLWYEPLGPRCGQTCAGFRWEANARVPTEAPCRRAAGHDGNCNQHAYEQRTPSRWQCTVPAGTVLRVSRIYIRQGAPGYDSLTFWAEGLAKKKVRFFARLSDVNTMVVADGPLPARGPRTKPQPLRAIRLRE